MCPRMCVQISASICAQLSQAYLHITLAQIVTDIRVHVTCSQHTWFNIQYNYIKPVGIARLSFHKHRTNFSCQSVDHLPFSVVMGFLDSHGLSFNKYEETVGLCIILSYTERNVSLCIHSMYMFLATKKCTENQIILSYYVCLYVYICVHTNVDTDTHTKALVDFILQLALNDAGVFIYMYIYTQKVQYTIVPKKISLHAST